MPGRLQDRIAVITGSSSGIGRETALLFAKEGAKIVCADLQPGTWREDAAQNGESDGPTHERITKDGGSAIFVKTDVSKAEEVEALVAAAVKEHGRLDIMINNAGFALESRNPQPVWDMPLDVLDKMLPVNINGVYYGVKYAAKQMISQEPLQPSGDRGWILNAASVYGLVGTPHASVYCTTKGAVANLTRAAALDCAPYRVHVNAVAPGYVHSHMTDPLFAASEVRQEIEPLHPFRGLGKPEDIAKAYLFLASDDAQWMSGVNMNVDGGFLAR
ncbi:hypothetical protein BST61_g1312 [Cercospora zeina]